MRRFLTLFLPLIALMVCGTSCDNEPDTHTYYWFLDKTPLEIMENKAYVTFSIENEEKLETELSKLGLSLTDIKDGENLDSSFELTEEASGILRNYRTATVTGDSRKAESVRSLTLGWSPYYKVTDKNDFMPGRELASNIYFNAKIAAGADESRLMELAKRNNVIYGGKDSFLEGWYLFIVTNDSRGNTLEMANLFKESGLCEHSEPNFVGIQGALCSF